MSKDEITKIFQYFQKFDKRLANIGDTMVTNDDTNQILNRLDSIEKQLEIDNDERLVMGHQLDRLDKWVHGVADKIGYKLTT